MAEMKSRKKSKKNLSKAQAAVRNAGISQYHIAKVTGFAEPVVCIAMRETRCLMGGQVWQIRMKICELTGSKYKDLWPMEQPSAEPALK